MRAYAHPIIRELSTSREAQVRRQAPVAVPQHQRAGAQPEWDIGLQKTGYISEAGRCLVMQAQLAGPQADHGAAGFGRQATRASAMPSASASG
jgi:serine-type D-Ala-D-Ala endopeptidase (penicillin-binding protein 7)